MRRSGGRRGGDLARFLAEDSAGRDITGSLIPDAPVRGRIVSRGRTVVAGAAHAREIFAMRGCAAMVAVRDGGEAGAGDTVVSVRGGARSVLACERTALNLLSRMSGIAAATRRVADALEGTGVDVLATRKTAPGLRAFDKEAVEIGGGKRHRMSLGDAVLIKDNHIAAGGPVGELVGRARERRAARRGRWVIEAEAETVQEALEAAAAGADAVLLDNFSPAGVRRAVAALERAGLRGAVRIEASGGITLRNAARYAAAGADSVSIGALTHSAMGADYTLVVEPRRPAATGAAGPAQAGGGARGARRQKGGPPGLERGRKRE